MLRGLGQAELYNKVLIKKKKSNKQAVNKNWRFRDSYTPRCSQQPRAKY